MDDLNIPKDQVELLRNAFVCFDAEKKGCINTEMVGTILELLGHVLTPTQLQEIVQEVDVDGSGELEFEEFCILASKFLTLEEEDSDDLMVQDLKVVFRFYDREENGFITTDDFKDLLREIDPTMTERELQGVVDEIDLDGSGTLDFEEFVKALR
ncbi:troponin C, isoallergen Bla g 6.0101-like [Macrosteles quadrilineatus]|uniref:troponin C, isoallergen Bla g 6.0101-like n=1 Tax=Macrosteles quadrilineatus TaxID=74068 RepID=UPI0023E31FA5|nr:troponin C, isoallergen Bla g 6.0101-like [Macrosteles quadrilineatus]